METVVTHLGPPQSGQPLSQLNPTLLLPSAHQIKCKLTPRDVATCERDLGTPPLLLILKREKIMVDNDKALEQRARRAAPGIGRAFCGGIPSDDCEEVARVILGADMNMRQSFKPK